MSQSISVEVGHGNKIFKIANLKRGRIGFISVSEVLSPWVFDAITFRPVVRPLYIMGGPCNKAVPFMVAKKQNREEEGPVSLCPLQGHVYGLKLPFSPSS